MTSNDLGKPETNTEAIVKRTSNKRNKNILKAGSVHENIEFSNEYLDENPILMNYISKKQCKFFLTIN